MTPLNLWKEVHCFFAGETNWTDYQYFYLPSQNDISNLFNFKETVTMKDALNVARILVTCDKFSNLILVNCTDLI